MKEQDLDAWWCGLTCSQKERIASKIASKQNGAPTVVVYPECSEWWNALDAEKKEFIHDHCTDKHGYLLEEWSEGSSYSY